MRHRKSGRKLNRTWEHRKAMFRNMARSVLVHQRIRTTEAKAKELRSFVDKLITLTKTDTLHSRRQAYKVLENHGLVKTLFDEIGPRFAGVSGGYTRVIKLGLPRKGDAAPMAIIELTRTGATQAPEETPAKTTATAAPEEAPEEKAEVQPQEESESPLPEPEPEPAEKASTKESPEAEEKKE
ncbi:MAG: 50S ribosomal protein L17 [Desulfovibrionales bacterium]